jgi:hypothetical protein
MALSKASGNCVGKPGTRRRAYRHYEEAITEKNGRSPLS